MLLLKSFQNMEVEMSLLKRLCVLFSTLLCTHSFADEFSISFEWGDFPSCRSGNPLNVENPIFTLTNVPDGTTWINFKMKDKRVPSFNHGGGWVKYDGNDRIERGQFKYRSPCPPGGVHTYEWTAKALSEKKISKKTTLGIAKASKDYPE